LRYVAGGETPQSLFTGEVILARWEQIQEALTIDDDNKLFDELITKLAQEHGLCDAIRNSEDGFNVADAELYWRIVRSASVDLPEFFNWCKDGLEHLDKDDWLSDLNDTDECVWLGCMLIDKGVKIALTTHFADALVDHAVSAIKGEKVSETAVIDRWQDVLSFLEQSTRMAIRPRLLSVALDADGIISKEFVTMYGVEIADREVLSTNNRSVEGLFSPIVRQRNIPGLTWLAASFNGTQEFLDALQSQSNTGEFRTRLQDCVNDPEEDEAQPLISQLANALGIEVAVPESDSESEASE
jgi:hypothetical protein